ncbi:TauD/TfdA family dioxygenase [Sorangium sp. So ce388]
MSNSLARYTGHPGAWKASDLTKEKISFDLAPRHLKAFENIIDEARKRKLTLRTASESDFPLVEIHDDIRRIADEVLHKRGVIVIRGWPVEAYTPEEMGLLFWSVGKQLGVPVEQSHHGDRLNQVIDLGGRRAYNSNIPLDMHSDFSALVGLLTIRKAKLGGHSGIASALAIHDKIAETHPEYLAPLYTGYYVHWQGEEAKGERSLITDYPVPVFSDVEGQLSVFMVKPFVEQAARNKEMTQLQREALDYFQQVADSDELAYKFMLEPGEASLMSNYTVLHSRSTFEDWPEVERRRLLLRLWLRLHHGDRRPLHPSLQRLHTHDGFYVSARNGEAPQVSAT